MFPAVFSSALRGGLCSNRKNKGSDPRRPDCKADSEIGSQVVRTSSATAGRGVSGWLLFTVRSKRFQIIFRQPYVIALTLDDQSQKTIFFPQLVQSGSQLELSSFPNIIFYMLLEMLKKLRLDNVLTEYSQVLVFIKAGRPQIVSGVIDRGFFGKLSNTQEPALFQPNSGGCAEIGQLVLRRAAQTQGAYSMLVIDFNQLLRA
jgi:hypothetical protein